MLLPSPEIQKRLEKYQTFDAAEADALKHEWKRLKRRRNTLLRTFAGIALLGAGIGAYTHDVQANEAIQAEASISVNVAGPALDKANNDNALVFIDGFDSYNSDRLTTSMSKAVQPVIDGQLWSVGYNNAPLESEEIASTIIDTVKHQKEAGKKVTSLTIVGYSAGGDVAMEVQEEIHKESNLDINAIFLVSTPDGAKALRPARQDEIDLVEKFAWIPGIEFSTPLRALGEMAFRVDRYTSGAPLENVMNFFKTAHQVGEDLESNKVPGTWLMFDQMMAIEHANLKDRIDTMKDMPTYKVRPTIIYLGTAKPGYDYMVDDKKSSSDIGAYAMQPKPSEKTADTTSPKAKKILTTGIPFLSYDVPGAVHSMIEISNDQYIKTLAGAKPAILGSIATQKSIASLHRVTSFYIPPATKK